MNNEDIKVLEDMRDNIYGAIQFEDDYQVRALEQKQFDALNLAINHLRKTKLVHSQFVPKSKVREKIDILNTNIVNAERFDRDYIGNCRFAKYILQELLQEGDDK